MLHDPNNPTAGLSAPAARVRRTRSGLLALVVSEVDAMVTERVRGPVSLLVSRLAARGVRVTEATLRAGDCRGHLERVWERRALSVRSFGPTGGHDLRPTAELVEHIIDLKWRIGRTRADLRGEVFDRSATAARDRRSLAACGFQEREVARKAAMVVRLLPRMAAQGIFPNFDTLSAEMGKAGEPITARTIRRNEAYWRPMLHFLGIDPPVQPKDFERASLMVKSAEPLGALVFALLAELASVEAEFAASLDAGSA